MRVIIGAVFVVVTVCVFVAVTVAIFIIEHIFAITVLGAAVAAVMLVVRHQQRLSPRRRLPAHQPSHYPAILVPARPAPAATPQWAADGMSSSALRSRAHRSLPPSGRRSYP
jgi:hypothetical protein